jgi:hypothetical protein
MTARGEGVREIVLLNGMVSLVDENDFEFVRGYTWYFKKSHGRENNGYARTVIDGRHWFLHGFIMGAKTGHILDHINRDKLDNRRCNLRFCDFSQNNLNKENYPSQTGFRGLNYFRGKYYAMARKKALRLRGPLRTDPAEAARDYDLFALQLFGEFACLNFPKVATGAATQATASAPVTSPAGGCR